MYADSVKVERKITNTDRKIYLTDSFMAITNKKLDRMLCTRVYPEVSGLATWSEKFKRYSSLPLGAVVTQFCESV